MCCFPEKQRRVYATAGFTLQFLDALLRLARLLRTGSCLFRLCQGNGRPLAPFGEAPLRRLVNEALEQAYPD